MVRVLVMSAVVVASFGATSNAGLILTGTSYEQNFNSLVLPDNWTVRTGASATALGSVQSLSATRTWGNTGGRFFSSASVTGQVSNADSATQDAAADRALSVRQTGAFDPGAAFVLELENTMGFESFSVGFNAEMQSVQPRTTTWRVDFGTGASPSAFTSIGTVSLGTEFGETANTFSFGSQLDNLSGPVWIRIATVTESTGSDARDTFGIDDFQLSYSVTAVPEPSSLLLLGLAGVSVGVGRRWRRKKLVV